MAPFFYRCARELCSKSDTVDDILAMDALEPGNHFQLRMKSQNHPQVTLEVHKLYHRLKCKFSTLMHNTPF